MFPKESVDYLRNCYSGWMRLRKASRSKLRQELITLAKTYAKIRDGWICQMCGRVCSPSVCHGSHVIPVSQGGSLPFDPINIKALCFHCHQNIWHLEPTKSGEWFINKFPERWKHIQSHRNDIVKWSIDDYREKIKEMKQAIDELAPGYLR